jgi:signal transduction histidine kinase
LAQQVINDYTDLFSNSGCPIETHIESSLTANCDPLRIEQVIINLVANALKYGCAKPVQVSLKKANETLAFSIKDHGPGIPKEYQSRIFERYGRVEGMNDLSGLGLGLFISKQFIEAHGGRIWVESEPGKGAQFSFEIPAEQTV